MNAVVPILQRPDQGLVHRLVPLVEPPRDKRAPLPVGGVRRAVPAELHVLLLQILELGAELVHQARADEVHLVLSSTAGAASLVRTASQFAEVGTTALVLTKLDEVSGLGNLLPLLRSSKLPLSYVTDGQNVPDDIQPADSRRLARMVLGMEI